MEIIDLDDHRKVWKTGAAACAACGHEWQQVYPIGAEDVGLECPSCGSGHGSVLTITQTAKRMWDAYATRLGGKNYKGEPLPSWDDLGDERQYCWIGVSEVTSDRIFKLEAALREIADGPRDVNKSYVSLLHEIKSEARKALGEKE